MSQVMHRVKPRNRGLTQNWSATPQRRLFLLRRFLLGRGLPRAVRRRWRLVG